MVIEFVGQNQVRIQERAVAEENTQEPTDFIDLFLEARAEQDFDNHAEFTKIGVHVRALVYKQACRYPLEKACNLETVTLFQES